MDPALKEVLSYFKKINTSKIQERVTLSPLFFNIIVVTNQVRSKNRGENTRKQKKYYLQYDLYSWKTQL